MKKSIIIPIFLLAILVSISIVASELHGGVVVHSEPIIVKNGPPANNESLIAFNKMMDVLTHQRCMNCHPSDDVPKQGEDSHPHRFGITRANGLSATNCNTCHQSSNNDYSGVPGAPEWALAPHSMRWEGLSRIQIAKSMMNKENNGGRSPDDIMHHLTEHELVLWAWQPGVNAAGEARELPPVSKEEYIAAVKKWIELGAEIPEE